MVVLGSKRVIFRRGTPALYRPLVFPSYDLPIPWQVLTFVEFILGFSLYEMSLDISNPCGFLTFHLPVFPKKSVPTAKEEKRSRQHALKNVFTSIYYQ